MKRQGTFLLCPTDPRHGALLEIDGALRCPHQEHDGRPSTHPLGPLPMSRSRFTLDEALASREAPDAGSAAPLVGASPALRPGASPDARRGMTNGDIPVSPSESESRVRRPVPTG